MFYTNLHYQCAIAILSVSIITPVQAAVISEFEPNQIGIDAGTQTIELSGTPGVDFAGWVLAIGGEMSRFGTVDRAIEINGVFGSDGLLTTSITDFLDPTFTIVLADDFTGTVGVTDIDGNNDGIADDTSSIGNIQDALGVAGSEFDVGRLYGSDLGGQDLAFTGDQPRLVFRDASVGDWYALNDPDNGMIFDIDGNDVSNSLSFNGDPFSPSFGEINPTVSAVPEPSSLLALASLSVVAIRRRWKKR
ncbi:PEP-CTERM sorting domain-containing protein [Rhodopirellula europaea]|nr:PEP-CTERM sorting domain-containing protein [Rhodopirellula europaea]